MAGPAAWSASLSLPWAQTGRLLHLAQAAQKQRGRAAYCKSEAAEPNTHNGAPREGGGGEEAAARRQGGTKERGGSLDQWGWRGEQRPGWMWTKLWWPLCDVHKECGFPTFDRVSKKMRRKEMKPRGVLERAMIVMVVDIQRSTFCFIVTSKIQSSCQVQTENISRLGLTAVKDYSDPYIHPLF